jgi:PAS domain S-box-containing protein
VAGIKVVTPAKTVEALSKFLMTMPITYKRKSTISRTGVFFLFSILLSAGAAALAYYNVRVFEARAILVGHTQNVLLQMEETHSTLRDLVSAARGYALSGKHEYLLNFDRDRSALFDSLDRLRAAQRDDQVQLDRLAQLSTSIVKRVEMARALFDVDRKLQTDHVDEHGRDLGEDIRKQFEVLKESEQRLLEERINAGKQSIDSVVQAIAAVSLLSLVILVAVYLRLKREILSRKEAQLRLQFDVAERAALYHQAPCGYHAIDEESHLIIAMNDTELAWLGYAREQVIGKMMQTDLITAASALVYNQEIRPHVLSGKPVSDVEMDYLRADGSHFQVSMNIHLGVHDENGVPQSRYMVRDVSERVRAQQEISQLRADLNQQIKNLASINKELESFSYSVSHDLRAPLRAISGYALMVEEDYSEALGSKGQELLQVIGKNVKKMDSLINDLLKLSKATSGELITGYFLMQELVARRVAMLQKQYGRVQFIIEPLPDVSANQALLEQVWENLLDNAVKFSTGAEFPVVRVSGQVAGAEVIYRVLDNGVGFDMRYVHKLFGTFQRLHRQQEFTGTGIGLALVQRIVVRHGGRVWAESVTDEGTSFYFALPRILS